jgi:hypothetical protein
LVKLKGGSEAEPPFQSLFYWQRNKVEMDQEKQLAEGLDAIEQGFALDPNAVQPADVGDLCQKYRDLKPTIEGVLVIIENIPLPIFKQVARLVRTLMVIADTACPG